MGPPGVLPGEFLLKGDAEIMPKAVRYDEFGGIDVLRVDEVERPVPGDGQVLVRVKAAGINPARPRSAPVCCTPAGPPPSRPGRAAISPGSLRRPAPGPADSRPATR